MQAIRGHQEGVAKLAIIIVVVIVTIGVNIFTMQVIKFVAITVN